MPYPFLESLSLSFTHPTNPDSLFEFKVNYFMTTLSCLRLLPPATAIMLKSKYLSPRSYRLGKLNNTTPDLLYALKCYFKDKPMSFIGVVVIVSVVMFSFALRVAEYQFLSRDTYTAYSNIIWLTAMNMTTVGFGDVVPVTPIGRIIAALCAIWGVLIVAVMVGVLTHILSLTSKETQSLTILKKLQCHSNLKQAAGLYLRSSLWRLWLNHKYKLNRP
jgi:hypothetical protein